MKKSFRNTMLALAAGTILAGFVAKPYVLPRFSGLVENVMPGVVYVSSETEVGIAIGSGFIFTDSGLILTNWHVVGDLADPEKLFIRAKSNSRPYEATIVGGDVLSDVALLRIDEWASFKRDVPYKVLHLEPARLTKEGDDVWAVGMPADMSWTLTRGYLSAPARHVDPLNPVYFLQTDLRITKGNSGGPLFNANGGVIGINNMIRAVAGGEISYAIPSEIIEKVVHDLKIKKNNVVWASLGIGFSSSPDGVGVIVEYVNKKSPALDILHKGDKLLEASTRLVVSKPLIEEYDLPDLIHALNPGDWLRMKVINTSGELITANVMLAIGKNSHDILDDIALEHKPTEKE